MNILLPSSYFPPISYFACLLRNEAFFERHEHFVKQTLRSRCRIVGANGPLLLKVPRKRSTDRLSMKCAAIHNDEAWQTLHWRSLQSAYRNSPYFEYYEDEMASFFSKEEENLFNLNMRSIELICKLLQIEFEPAYTEAYSEQFDGCDLRNAWDGRKSAVGSPVSMFPEYIQVFTERRDFIPDLSILDLLFCQGPQTIDYLNDLEMNFCNGGSVH